VLVCDCASFAICYSTSSIHACLSCVRVCACELVCLEALLGLCLFLLVDVCELVDLEVLIASETCCASCG
jgi:hypothetical protein